MTGPQISKRSWAMVLALGLTWGSTFLVIELALRGIGPMWLAASRIGLASAVMAAVQWYRGVPLFSGRAGPRPWGMLVIVALLSSAVPFNLLSWGQQHVTSAFAGVSMAAVALMVLPLAHVMVAGERLTGRKAAGFALGFGGVVLLAGGQAFDTSGSALEPLGRAACLTAAACYALSSVLVRRLPPVDPVVLSGVLLYIGAVAVIPAAFLVEGVPSGISAETLLWVVLLGLIPTAGANVLRVLVIRTAGPTFMSLTNYIVPVVSILMGWLILSEPVPGSLIMGILLILGGLALSQARAPRIRPPL